MTEQLVGLCYHIGTFAKDGDVLHFVGVPKVKHTKTQPVRTNTNTPAVCLQKHGIHL